jgi:hypothetical protein
VRFDFDYYETFSLEGSQMDALNFAGLMRLQLKAGDSLDILLLKDRNTGGYYKGFFEKNIHIYNIRKGSREFVNLDERNKYEKQRWMNRLFTCVLCCFPLIRFIFLEIKKYLYNQGQV